MWKKKGKRLKQEFKVIFWIINHHSSVNKGQWNPPLLTTVSGSWWRLYQMVFKLAGRASSGGRGVFLWGNEHLREACRLSVWLPNPLKWLHALHPSSISGALQPHQQKNGTVRRRGNESRTLPVGGFLWYNLDVSTCVYICVYSCVCVGGNFVQLTGDSTSNWGQNWRPCLIFYCSCILPDEKWFGS